VCSQFGLKLTFKDFTEKLKLASNCKNLNPIYIKTWFESTFYCIYVMTKDP